MHVSAEISMRSWFVFISLFCSSFLDLGKKCSYIHVSLQFCWDWILWSNYLKVETHFRHFGQHWGEHSEVSFATIFTQFFQCLNTAFVCQQKFFGSLRIAKFGSKKVGEIEVQILCIIGSIDIRKTIGEIDPWWIES